MECLTDQHIKAAFDKTLSEYPVDDGKLCLIRKEHYDKVLQFLQDDLIKDEHICQALNLKWSPEIEELFLVVLGRNISLVLLDNKTDDVIGVRLMGVAKAEEPVVHFKDKALEDMVNFWRFADQKAQFFKHYNTNVAIHYFGLGVGVKYRQRGIGTKLVQMSLNFLKNLDIFPVYVKADASSVYSQRIFAKLGFDLLTEVKYDDYEVVGQVIVKSTETQKSLRAYGIQICSELL